MRGERKIMRKLSTLTAPILALALLVTVTACSNKGKETAPAAGPVATGKVDGARLKAVASEPGEWPAAGRDAGKTHYSPLDQINQSTVGRLGFAWQLETGTNRGMQATPIVVDGVMYVSGVAGRVYTINATNGELIWQFEPNVDLRHARSSCCDIVNRGVAVWQGKVYVATTDGVLYALNARDGKVLWQTPTIEDNNRAYAVTGAPQIAGKVVVIGNSGAEFDSRGYVSAYDLETGKMVWRFYTVPGDPSKPFESKALEMAAKTWAGSNYQWGGGANAWDAFNYDPELNLVYFGTANGAPWNRKERSPGGGDNLFVASIIAVNADTGEYAWHYQTTPGENWDYDATPHIMLTTLKWGDQDRNVLMQASKNGFFYVLDRKTGELLAADKFVDANWADHVDLKTGRPIENRKAANYNDGKPVVVFPSGVGGHNFNPMSLSAKTGLVYIPTVHSGMAMLPGPKDSKFLPERMHTRVQIVFANMLTAPPATLPPAMRSMLTPEFLKNTPSLTPSAALKAWDPITRKVVWSVPNTSFMDHGGVLTTAGGLVVQGGLDGKLRVYGDTDGKLLKEIEVGTAMIAGASTYLVNGVQYIAIAAGTGGGGWNMWFPENIAFKKGNANRILAFRLDGGITPVPPDLPAIGPLPEPPAAMGTAADAAAGAALFGANCASCHSNYPRSPVPDLRRSSAATHAAFKEIVLRGALQPRGMPSFDDLLSEKDVEQIHAHIVSVARQAYADEQKAAPPTPAAAVKEGHL
jgi:quinohemoprotein ethanol dehydrogenase